MSKTKAGGSTRLGRDSRSKRLGIKKFGSESIKTGNIIARQRGSKYLSGQNTIISKDHTILAKADGKVRFSQIRKTNFSGKKIRKTVISVEK